MEKIKNFLLKNAGVKQTLAKNTFWLFASEILSRFLKLGLIIYAARALGKSEWGVFSYALSIGALLMTFSDLGLSGLITREVAQEKEGHSIFVTTAVMLKIIALLLSIILLILISPLISRVPPARTLFPIIAVIFFFDSLRELCLAVNRAFEKMEREMIVRAIMSALILVLGIVFLKMKLAPESMALAYALGSTVSFILIAFLARVDIKKVISTVDFSKFKTVLKTTWPFAIIPFVGTIMANTDIYMLGIWRNAAEIGLYAAVERIQQFVLIIPSTIAIAVFPLVSRFATNADNQQRILLEKTISLITIMGLPLALGGIVLADQIVLLIFGPEYLGAVTTLRILMLILLISFPLILLSNTILAYAKQQNLILVFLLGIVANVVLNTLFIPKWGAAGSALATLLSTLVTTLIIYIKLKKIVYFETLPWLKKISASAIAMIILTLLLKYLGIHLLINIVLSGTVYFFFLYLMQEPILLELKTIFSKHEYRK